MHCCLVWKNPSVHVFTVSSNSSWFHNIEKYDSQETKNDLTFGICLAAMPCQLGTVVDWRFPALKGPAVAVGGMIVAHPTIVGELTSLFDPAERMDTARGNTSPGASSKVVVGVMMVVVATGVGQVLMRLGLVVWRISLTACCMWWRATVIRVGHLPFQPGTIRDQSAKAFEQMLSYVLKTWFMFIVYQDALEWLSAYSTVKKRNLLML